MSGTGGGRGTDIEDRNRSSRSIHVKYTLALKSVSVGVLMVGEGPIAAIYSVK